MGKPDTGMRAARDAVDEQRAALEACADEYARTGGMDMHLQGMCQAAIKLRAAKIMLAGLKVAAKT